LDKKYIMLALVLIYGIYDAINNSDYLNTTIVILLAGAIYLNGKKEAKGAKYFRFFSIVSILLAAALYIYKISTETSLI